MRPTVAGLVGVAVGAAVMFAIQERRSRAPRADARGETIVPSPFPDAPRTDSAPMPIAPAPSRDPAVPESPPGRIEPGAPTPVAPRTGPRAPVGISLADSDCRRRLAEVEVQLDAEHRQKRAVEGAPIAAPKDVPPRLRQEALVQAGSLALRQARVPGRVETIDCAEYPCILYGRIDGDEDLIERVERAPAFAPYADDILTLLSWAATDEAARAAGRRAPHRPERMLVALAIYTREEHARMGDAIDRRVRVRTADLWNALRPDDED